MHGVVEVRGGRVRGVERDGIWSFSGVPYAATPAGERRWRPPAPPVPWAGIRDCDRFGPVAPQAMGFMDQALSGGGEPPESDEDCLNLNVWTPGLDGVRRPVMVWVHGGSFMTGTGSSGLYRGGQLARTEDVVVVTINYRLGLLGFLAHPALDEPGQTWLDGREWTGSGNWGLADQVAALVWVRDHIAEFGGDPGNVTLFGESAGGMSVSALLAAPAAAGLFHRAVVESGPPYTCTLEVATERAERLAAHLGLPCTRASLVGVPAEQLVAAGTDYVEAGADAGLLMTPVVDGGLLAEPPEEAVVAGSAASIPLLIGTNRDESAFFVLGSPKLMGLSMDGLRSWVRRVTPDDEAADRVVSAVLGGSGRPGRVGGTPRPVVGHRHRGGVPGGDGAFRHRPRVGRSTRGGHVRLPLHLGVAGVRGRPRVLSRTRDPVRVRHAEEPRGPGVLGRGRGCRLAVGADGTGVGELRTVGRPRM